MLDAALVRLALASGMRNVSAMLNKTERAVQPQDTVSASVNVDREKKNVNLDHETVVQADSVEVHTAAPSQVRDTDKANAQDRVSPQQAWKELNEATLTQSNLSFLRGLVLENIHEAGETCTLVLSAAHGKEGILNLLEKKRKPLHQDTAPSIQAAYGFGIDFGN